MTPGAPVAWVRPRMGTLLAVVQPAGSAARHLAAAGLAFSIAARCERIMNRHDAESDVGRLNRAAGSPAGVVAPELARILRSARALSRRLDGAFDPAAGALVDLWRQAGRGGRAPAAAAVAGALARSGGAALALAGDRIALPRPGSSVDLDAFAKGLALDRIASPLRRRGAAALLNFGESSMVAVGGLPGDCRSILLRNPFGGFAGEFDLRDRACSTSAALAGRRGSRGRGAAGVVVDPRTGRRVERSAQVTVLARSAAVAEAASTALLVLGRAAVDEVAARLAVDVCWIDPAGIFTSAGFSLDRAA